MGFEVSVDAFSEHPVVTAALTRRSGSAADNLNKVLSLLDAKALHIRIIQSSRNTIIVSLLFYLVSN